MSEFLQRLKQRKLVQWTLAYVAAAFALLQGIDIVAQRFGWSEQTMRLVIIALSVGFSDTIYRWTDSSTRDAATLTLISLVFLLASAAACWLPAWVAARSARAACSCWVRPWITASIAARFSVSVSRCDEARTSRSSRDSAVRS